MAVAKLPVACAVGLLSPYSAICRLNCYQVCTAGIKMSLHCCRTFSTSSLHSAGQKWRIRQGQAPDGIAYGPLTDLPDWSYADGRPAPETKARRRRKLKRLDVAERIQTLLREVDEAAKRDEYSGQVTDTDS